MIDEDLPSDLRALFDAERAREAPAPQAKERVHGALAASIGGGFMPDGGPLDGGAGAAGAAGIVGAGVAGAGMKAAGVAAGSALGKGLAIALAVTMAGTTATGIYLAQSDGPAAANVVGVGADVPQGFDPSVLGARPAPAVAPSTPPRSVLAPIELAPVDLPPLAPAAEPTPEQRAERLAAERGLLDEARGAVSRGNGGAALIALEAHRASFPDGQLVEEREALTVMALAKADRLEEARAKAQRFSARWPASLFAAAVAQAIGE